jgi:uncharacterized protein YcbK (DUF882 family)
MKYLLYISIVWALALTAPNFIIHNRQINMVQEQQELQKKALEVKKLELEIINKMTPDVSHSKNKKEDMVF